MLKHAINGFKGIRWNQEVFAQMVPREGSFAGIDTALNEAQIKVYDTATSKGNVFLRHIAKFRLF